MSRWRLVKRLSKKPHGHVWILQRVTENGVQRGYFKFRTRRQAFYGGPLVANELIGARLARELGLPVAELQCIKFRGRHGIVSIAVTAPWRRRWRELPRTIRENVHQHFVNPDGLFGMFVFDVFTYNIDRRSGKNLIVYRDRGESLLNWYLIDHGHALFGSPYKWKRIGRWTDPVWDQIMPQYYLPRGLKSQITCFSQLEPWIEKCESLPDDTLRAIVSDVPAKFLPRRVADNILSILQYRRARLRRILRSWIHNLERQREQLVSIVR